MRSKESLIYRMDQLFVTRMMYMNERQWPEMKSEYCEEAEQVIRLYTLCPQKTPPEPLRPEHVSKCSELASVVQLQFNSMNLSILKKIINFSENQFYNHWNIDM